MKDEDLSNTIINLGIRGKLTEFKNKWWSSQKKVIEENEWRG